MAKILYGVAGEGFGHSSRSELLGQKLIQAGHDVMFAASGKSLRYLTPTFGDRAKNVHGLTFYYQDGRVHPLRTVMQNLKQYPQGCRLNHELFSTTVKQFKPDLVISDFEPYSAWWACRHRVPCVSIDHEHLLTCADFQKEPALWKERFMAQIVTRGYHTFADAYVVLNFFDVPINNRHATLTPPVVRKNVLENESVDGEHIVMYSTDSSEHMQKRIYDTVNQFKNHRFRIYGFNKDLKNGNCLFKKTSSQGFLRDLSTCRAVIASAGFSLISECLHYRKPMLLLPVQDQYEQLLNALYVEKLGLGHRTTAINADSVNRFLGDLDKFTTCNEKILVPDNDQFFSILDRTFEKIGMPLNLISPTNTKSQLFLIPSFTQKSGMLMGG